MDMGTHSRNHLDLLLQDDTTARDEIAGSQLDLESMLDVEMRQFCYPYGHFNETRRWMVEQATNWTQFLVKVTTGYQDRHR